MTGPPAVGSTRRAFTRVPVILIGIMMMSCNRFRSQVLIEFGQPIGIEDARVEDFRRDEQQAVLAMIALTFSFLMSVHLIEAEAGLLFSLLSLLRLTRLGQELEDLRTTRAGLVARVRELANRFADPDVPRIFTDDDFVRK